MAKCKMVKINQRMIPVNMSLCVHVTMPNAKQNHTCKHKHGSEIWHAYGFGVT